MKRRNFFTLALAALGAPFLSRHARSEVPKGTIVQWHGSEPPPGWKLTDFGHAHSVEHWIIKT